MRIGRIARRLIRVAGSPTWGESPDNQAEESEETASTDTEEDIHIWYESGDDMTDGMYTISAGKRPIAVKVSLDGAVDAMRGYLEDMQLGY